MSSDGIDCVPEERSFLSKAAGVVHSLRPDDAVTQTANPQYSVDQSVPALAIAPGVGTGAEPGAREGACAQATLWLVGDAEMRALLNSLGPLLEVGVNAFADAASFLTAFEPERPGCIIADAHLAGMSGLTLQNELAARGCRLPLIMAIRPGDVRTAVAATKAGAFDVVERPLSTDRMLECIRRGVATSA